MVGMVDTPAQSGMYASASAPALSSAERFSASSAAIVSGVTGSTASSAMPRTVSGSLMATRPSRPFLGWSGAASRARPDDSRSKTRTLRGSLSSAGGSPCWGRDDSTMLSSESA
jgi:hypothetical protein